MPTRSKRFKGGQRVWWRASEKVQKQVTVVCDSGIAVLIQDGCYEDGEPAHLNVSKHQLMLYGHPHLEDRTRTERRPF